MTGRKPLPQNFHWVLARAKCSAANVFKELELGIRDDVEKAQSLVEKHETIVFSVSQTQNNRFSVLRVDDPITSASESVDFSCINSAILVHGEGVNMCALLTLTNDGECKLRVEDDELDQWQFRKMALQKLFFRIP
jgi:hypothetical protein